MKNRLTFSTLGAPNLTFEDILATAQQFGMQNIELRGVLDKVEINDIPQLRPENRIQTKAKLDKAGVQICVLGCSAMFHRDTQSALNECVYAIEAAKELNIPYIRVFGERCENDEMFKKVVFGLQKVCAGAHGSGVRVLLEAHGDFTTIALLQKLFYAVNDADLGLIWDVAHTTRSGEDIKTFAHTMRDFIYHIHLKDYRRDNSLCLPGDGILDLQTAVKTLEALDYKGLYSLEWEKRWHSELPDINDALRRFVDLPFLPGEKT